MARDSDTAKAVTKPRVLSPVGTNLAFLARPPLLRTESRAEFDALQEAIKEEVKPKSFIEKMYVADACYVLWEILRLRRYKVAIVNAAYRRGLDHLIPQLSAGLYVKSFGFNDDLALQWCRTPEGKQKIARMLTEVGLDESAIEAEAILVVWKVLHSIEFTLISLENRRDRFLREIEVRRENLGRRLRAGTDRIIEADRHDAVAVQTSSPTAKSAA